MCLTCTSLSDVLGMKPDNVSNCSVRLINSTRAPAPKGVSPHALRKLWVQFVATVHAVNYSRKFRQTGQAHSRRRVFFSSSTSDGSSEPRLCLPTNFYKLARSYGNKATLSCHAVIEVYNFETSMAGLSCRCNFCSFRKIITSPTSQILNHE